MHLDIFSDTVCPWCYIGKRRLQRALEERPQPGLTVQWRAFQLNPDMPAEGMERQRYLSLKFGGAEHAQAIYDRVRQAGDMEQIPFAFEAIRRTPNTVDSHRLVRFAGEHGMADSVVDALFQAYFLQGQDIGEREVLIAAAAAAGLDPDETRSFLASDSEVESVRAEDAKARHVGIQGVPTFILDDKYVLSGAHPPEVLRQFFDLSRHAEPEEVANQNA